MFADYMDLCVDASFCWKQELLPMLINKGEIIVKDVNCVL